MISGIELLDNFISKIQESSSNSQYFEWIPYEQFEDIKSLSHSGLSNIHIAKWINGPIIDKHEQKRNGPLIVILKTLNWEKNDLELSTSMLNQVCKEGNRKLFFSMILNKYFIIIVNRFITIMIVIINLLINSCQFMELPKILQQMD
jgi:hypothetical protein